LKKKSEQRKKYERYLKSDAWQVLRMRVIHRDGAMCRAQKKTDDGRLKMCFSRVSLQVHHLTYERFGNERLSDLITVCEQCHKTIHAKIGVKHHGES